MFVLILGVLCFVMLLVTVIACGKYIEQVHHSESLQRSVDIYTARSAKDWNTIMKLLADNKNALGIWELCKKELDNERNICAHYKGLYRQAIAEAQEERDAKKVLREQLANKTQEVVVLARELDTYIAKFEGDM